MVLKSVPLAVVFCFRSTFSHSNGRPLSSSTIWGDSEQAPGLKYRFMMVSSVPRLCTSIQLGGVQLGVRVRRAAVAPVAVLGRRHAWDAQHEAGAVAQRAADRDGA